MKNEFMEAQFEILRKALEDAWETPVEVDVFEPPECLKAFANAIWQKAFASGYERGKSDEKDAKEIDQSLAIDKSFAGD